MARPKDDAIGVGISLALSVCMFSFVLWTIIRALKSVFLTKALKKKLQKQYANLSKEEKAAIANLEEEIKNTLDITAPGQGKARDAWKTWSAEDREGLHMWLPIENWDCPRYPRAYSPYACVHRF